MQSSVATREYPTVFGITVAISLSSLYTFGRRRGYSSTAMRIMADRAKTPLSVTAADYIPADPLTVRRAPR